MVIIISLASIGLQMGVYPILFIETWEENLRVAKCFLTPKKGTNFLD